MKREGKQEKYRRQFRLVVFFVVCVALYILYASHVAIDKMGDINICNDVTVLQDGARVEHVDVSDYNFGYLKSGDEVKLELTLPDSHIDGAMLEFRIYHCVIHVDLDGERIYSYGDENLEKHGMVGSGTHFIMLPDNYAGKLLTIELIVTEKNPFTTIDGIYFESQMELVKNFIKVNFLQIVSGVFLLGTGVVLLGFVFIHGKFSVEYRSLVWLAGISLSSAEWMMASNGVLQAFTSDLRAIGYVENLSLDFCLLFFLIFILDQNQRKQVQIVYGVLLGLTGLHLVTSCILDYMDIVHLPGSLWVFHILLVVAVVVTTVACLLQWKRRQGSAEVALFKGILVMAAVMCLELIRFYSQKYLPEYFAPFTISLLPIGVIVFLVSMFVMYATRMLQNFHENIEKRTLMYMAYTDSLTGIANRAKCEEVLAEYKTAENYTIYNFDLDRFKSVNDSYGHCAGDEVLKVFATNAKEVFGKDGFVGRMGGDEFIALAKTADEEVAEGYLRALEKRMEHLTLSFDSVYRIHFSSGYQIRHAKETSTAWETYRAADRCMYEKKRKKQTSDANKESGALVV